MLSPTLTFLRTAARMTPLRATTSASVAPLRRSFQTSPRALGSTKEDHMDRTRLNPSSTEYSKSGSDHDAAAMSDAAFNPDKTRPEAEVASAEEESGEVRQSNNSSEDPNPLDVSPGNKDVSDSKNPQEGGASRSPSESEGSKGRSRTSGRGSPAKHGGGKTGGGGVPGTS